MDASMLDGNAVAGLLEEVFGVDMTTAIATCGNCGAAEAAGGSHVYRGAGIVLRCAHCEHVLVRIVRSDTRLWISFPELRTLEIGV